MTRRLVSVSAWAVFFGIAGARVAAAQSAPPAGPSFALASIKECKSADPPSPSTSSPGRLGLDCWPLWRLIADAYETFASGTVNPLSLLVPQPLEDVPPWVKSSRYSIDAKADGPQSGAMMRGPMMQALLEERFHLRVHHETREVPVYLMTVDRGGSKLQPAREGGCTPVDPTDLTQSLKAAPGGKPWCLVPAVRRKGPLTVFDVHGISLDALAQLLHPEGLPVINRTGLKGAFDIHLEWDTDGPAAPSPGGEAASDPAPHTSAITATRRQLGLRLEPGKGPHELLVIDHIERPSAN